MTASDRGATPSWRDVVTALPDFGLGASFLVTWVVPEALGEQMMRHFMLVMLLAFVITRATGMGGHVVIARRAE
jgi:hypothetical protein